MTIKLILQNIFIFLILCFGISCAQDVTLEWDANTEPDIEGYKIYGRTSTNPNYTEANSVDAGNVTTYTIYNLDDTTIYYFVATAYDLYGYESDYSNEVCTDNDPAAPGEE